MLGISLETLYKIVNAIYLIAVAIAAVASVIIYQMSNIISEQKDQEFDTYKSKTVKEIAIANQAAEIAKQKAAELESKAAQYERDTELARLETQKVKQLISWRLIDKSTAEKLTKELKKKPGSLNLRYIDGDPEALYLAIQFGKIFEKAGWNVAPGAIKPANQILFGISIPPDAAGSQQIRIAFNMAGIDFGQEKVIMGAAFNISTIQNAPTLIIGSKQPTEFR